VFSRRRSALTALQAVIREGRATKRYMALLQGRLAQARITINEPLRKSILQGGERMVRVDAAGKPSVSHVLRQQQFADAALCEIAIETGRTHQIRVHAAHIGHAVAGDEKYGDRAFNQRMRELGLKRLFLHAMRFEFEIGERSYSFTAPMPEELRSVVNALERQR